MNNKQTNKSVTDTIKSWIWSILLISCFAEILFFPQIENLLGCFVLIYGQILVSKFVATSDNFKKYPLATLPVVFYGFFYYFLALPITLIEGKPLTFNFEVPYLTWGNHFISITVIVIAYKISIKLYRQKNMLTYIWKRIGYFSVPSETIIWALGFLGLIAFIYNMTIFRFKGDVQSTGNSISIIIDCLQAFAICPICLYFKQLYGDTSSSSATKKFVKFYIVLFAIIGVATTRRGPIFSAFLSIAIAYIYLIIINNKKILTKRNIFLILLGLYLVTGPIADLAAAMIINRQLQGQTSVEKTFNSVWKTYNDKELLHNSYQAVSAFEDNGGDNSAGWSEYYIDNIFLDRFCNLRVIDATLYNAKKAGFNNKRGHEYFKEYWINQLPSPIADALDLKKTVHYTVTDEMLNQNFKNRYSNFGNKVGGETGIGLYLLGYNYYLLAFIIYLTFFYVMNTFCIYKDNSIIFPLPVVMAFMSYCTVFNNANGIFTVMDAFTRPKLNSILIYCIIIFVLSLFLGKRSVKRYK